MVYLLIILCHNHRKIVMKKNNSDKNQTNGLFLSIGFFLSVFIVYSLLQIESPKQLIKISDQKEQNMDIQDIIVIPAYSIYEKAPVEHKKKKVILTDKYLEKDDLPTKEKIEKDILTSPQESETFFDPNAVDVEDPIEDPPIPVIFVERVPVFPGCDPSLDNALLKKCFSEKVGKFIRKRFNTNKAEDINLSGKQKIFSQFVVDQNGQVTDIKVRTPHPLLEQEAKRVIGLLPTMIPAKQQLQTVKVQYSIPIIFKIN